MHFCSVDVLVFVHFKFWPIVFVFVQLIFPSFKAFFCSVERLDLVRLNFFQLYLRLFSLYFGQGKHFLFSWYFCFCSVEIFITCIHFDLLIFRQISRYTFGKFIFVKKYFTESKFLKKTLSTLKIVPSIALMRIVPA